MTVGRGNIIKLPNDGPGLLFVNGAKYLFRVTGVWRSSAKPQVNQLVDVEFGSDGVVKAVSAVDRQKLAREQLNQLSSLAEGRAREIASAAKLRASALFRGRGVLGIGVLIALSLALLAGGVALALGFRSDLSHAGLATKIDEKLATGEKKCWAPDEAAATFPMLVEPRAVQHPIIDGLVKGGYISLGRQIDPRRSSPLPSGHSAPFALNLTDKGRDANVWREGEGFCIGRPRVADVLRWTEPSSSNGVLTTRVDYTWKLGDRPAWATPALFPSVEGMTKPEEIHAIAHKTPDGWKVVLP